MPDSRPEWLTETPAEPQFVLAVIDYDVACKPLQQIRVTRTEYIALKEALAEIREDNAAEPDVLLQIELQSVFTSLDAIEARINSFRRRILAGAVVEPGPLGTRFVDSLPNEECQRTWDEFGASNLTIYRVKSKS